jgi:hypothetical protein
MSATIIESTLLLDLSPEEQQLLSGGQSDNYDYGDRSYRCPKYRKYRNCYYKYYSKERPDDWEGGND